MSPRRGLSFARWCWLVACAGCAATPAALEDAHRREMLSMVLPAEVEVVAPFTRIGDFDGKPGPDGIELLLRAVNPLGDAGLMIVGDLQVELYEFVPGSADRKGRRLEFWNVALRTPEQQKRHWNRMTQMYEFRLGLNMEKLVPADRYVLYVTYNSPLGEHISDEHALDIELSPSARQSPVLGG